MSLLTFWPAKKSAETRPPVIKQYNCSKYRLNTDIPGIDIFKKIVSTATITKIPLARTILLGRLLFSTHEHDRGDGNNLEF